VTKRPRHIGQIASAASIVSAATLASRLLGFVRDMALAWLFGAGLTADAFFVAFRIPSTLRELLGEGALSAAFIPTFTRTATKEGREAAWDLASAVLGTLMVVLAVVSILGVILAPWVAPVLAPGFAQVPGKLPLTIHLLRVMFPYIFLVGLAALFMAILNSLGHFTTPALSPIVLNVCMIVALLLLAPHSKNPALIVSLAVLVGGAGQLLVQVPAALAFGWRIRPRVAPADPRVQHIARLMAPGVAGLAITQINVFVGTLLASFLAQGSVSALTYAFRLVQFPIGVVGVAIATGALPVMAASMAREAVGDLKGALQSSLRLAWFLTLPAMVGLIVFRLPILHVLFERGAFTRPVTLLTAEILMGYTIGLGFYVGNRILAPAFYAMHDTWTPVSSGMAAVGINILASLALMGPLGATGLALATAVASCGNFALLFVRLRRRVGLLGGRRLLRAGAKVGLACLPMATWGLLAQRWWDVLAVQPTLVAAGLLFLEMAVALGIFAAAAAAFGCEEFGWAVDLLRRRRKRTSSRGVFG
jgi:putative peptidoglycan lipid II flippase